MFPGPEQGPGSVSWTRQGPSSASRTLTGTWFCLQDLNRDLIGGRGLGVQRSSRNTEVLILGPLSPRARTVHLAGLAAVKIFVRPPSMSCHSPNVPNIPTIPSCQSYTRAKSSCGGGRDKSTRPFLTPDLDLDQSALCSVPTQTSINQQWPTEM